MVGLCERRKGVVVKSVPYALFAWLVCTGPVLAGGPIALVEDVSGTSAGVEAMEYVEAGKVIRLGPQESMVLTYLYSCVRERIEGGVVTVGREQSDVVHGKVERNSTKCDTGRMLFSAEVAIESAGKVFRSLDRRQDQSLAHVSR
jgi:hypothetical protein